MSGAMLRSARAPRLDPGVKAVCSRAEGFTLDARRQRNANVRLDLPSAKGVIIFCLRQKFFDITRSHLPHPPVPMSGSRKDES